MVKVGFSEGLDDILFPRLSNPCARFSFTEAGWRRRAAA
jgi:hypothetical protein